MHKIAKIWNAYFFCLLANYEGRVSKREEAPKQLRLTYTYTLFLNVLVKVRWNRAFSGSWERHHDTLKRHMHKGHVITKCQIIYGLCWIFFYMCFMRLTFWPKSVCFLNCLNHLFKTCGRWKVWTRQCPMENMQEQPNDCKWLHVHLKELVSPPGHY